MTTTEPIGALDAPHGVQPVRPPDPSDAVPQARDVRFPARSSASAQPAHGESLGALIGAVPGEGPPIILLAGPLVLFGLALAGPFLLLLTLVVLVVACVALVALGGAVVASPYLLARRFRRHRLARPRRSARAAHFVAIDSGRGPA